MPPWGDTGHAASPPSLTEVSGEQALFPSLRMEPGGSKQGRPCLRQWRTRERRGQKSQPEPPGEGLVPVPSQTSSQAVLALPLPPLPNPSPAPVTSAAAGDAGPR